MRDILTNAAIGGGIQSLVYLDELLYHCPWSGQIYLLPPCPDQWSVSSCQGQSAI